MVDSRSARVPFAAEAAFAPIAAIGGATGWYAFDLLWRLRGAVDILVGGVGLRRGRPESRPLRPGDPLDFWRVEAVDPPRHLHLRAEMRLPGRAWLKFEVDPEPGGARIRQIAIFEPRGLPGTLYWYSIWPLHALVFRGMMAGIARAARRYADHANH